MLKNPTNCVVEDWGVKVKEAEGDRSLSIEMKLALPLTRLLAESIHPDVAADLFTAVKRGEWKPKQHMTAETFDLPFGGMLLKMQTHPDLKVEGLVHEAQVKDMRAKKATSGAWDLKFTVFFPIPADDVVLFMLKRIKAGMYLTLAKDDLLSQAEQTSDGTTPVDPDATTAQGSDADKKLHDGVSGDAGQEPGPHAVPDRAGDKAKKTGKKRQPPASKK